MAETEKKSYLVAYSVRKTTAQNGESTENWCKIGIVFKNRDDSFTVILNALPIGDRILIRPASNGKSTENNKKD